MTTDFGSLKLSDGWITEVAIRRGELVVRLRDWQDRVLTLTFGDVVGFEGLGAIGNDLGQGEESTDDPFIGEACRRADEPAEGCRCFSLPSAWTGEPALRIVARRFSGSWPDGGP